MSPRVVECMVVGPKVSSVMSYMSYCRELPCMFRTSPRHCNVPTTRLGSRRCMWSCRNMGIVKMPRDPVVITYDVYETSRLPMTYNGWHVAFLDASGKHVPMPTTRAAGGRRKKFSRDRQTFTW